MAAALRRMSHLGAKRGFDGRAPARAGLAEHTAAKEAANGRLQACAAKYNALMKEHREAYAASQSAAAFAKTT